jgi:hypothetical protein
VGRFQIGWPEERLNLLDVKLIRTETETERVAAALRKRMPEVDFSEILQLDEERRA